MDSKKIILNQPIENGVLVFNKSFNSGWNAYLKGKTKINKLNQIKINNWANGWQLEKSTNENNQLPATVYIFFWPQILEFIGFGLGIATVVWTTKK